MFETLEWTNFFNKLNFTPPSCPQLSITLLEKAYNKTKEQVLKIVSKVNYIQIVANGSVTIAKTRVENVSFLVNSMSFYWKSIEISAQKARVEFLVKNIKTSTYMSAAPKSKESR
jgi:hypothetical protein